MSVEIDLSFNETHHKQNRLFLLQLNFRAQHL